MPEPAEPGDDRAPTSTPAPVRPHLSVIVPCYNATATLPILLESLFDQVGAPPIEIVLADNRSQDDIRGLVDAFVRTHEAPHVVGVRVVPALAHQGLPYTRNVAAAHARADRLVTVDADDLVSRHWCADAEALFEVSDVFGGSAMAVLDPEFDGGLASVRRLFEAPGVDLALHVDQRSAPFPVIMGGDLGITRALFEDLGGFDQSMALSSEDNDLALRLRQRGIEVGTSYGLRIAYRQRIEPAGLAAEARRSATAHVLLAVRYGLLRRSPLVGGARLPRSCVRLVRTALRALLTGDPDLRRGVRVDAGRLLGTVDGVLRYAVLGRPPAPLLGIGLAEDNRPPPRTTVPRP